MPFKIVCIPAALLGILVFVLMSRYNRQASRERQQATGQTKAAAATDPVDWGRLVPFMALSVLAGAMIASASSFMTFYAVDELNVPVTTIPLLTAITPAMGLVMAPLGGFCPTALAACR